jgi:hypothetical protein
MSTKDKSAAAQPGNWQEFWEFYVREHANKKTRQLHFIGTTGALAFAATAALTGKPRWLLAALASGYGFAWYSHFAIEKNKPATFKYPGKSLAADFVMWWKTLNGTMDAEVAIVLARSAAVTAEEAQDIAVAAN